MPAHRHSVGRHEIGPMPSVHQESVNDAVGATSAERHPDHRQVAIAHATDLPVVYCTKDFQSDRTTFRLSVRQAGDGHYVETLEVESRASENVFIIHSVTPVGRDLTKAVSSAEGYRREWMLCEQEERDGFVQDEI